MFISTIYSVDGTPVWMNPSWYLANPVPIADAEYMDVFGCSQPPPVDFALERKTIMDSDQKSIRGRIAYNMRCGLMLIAIFREDALLYGPANHGLQLFQTFQAVECALLAGAFFEAIQMLDLIPHDEWWSPERLERYKQMLKNADSIGVQNG